MSSSVQPTHVATDSVPPSGSGMKDEQEPVKPSVIVSFDVENDGPSVLLHSALMFGFAVIDLGGPPPMPRGAQAVSSVPQPSSSSSTALPSYVLELKDWYLLPQRGKSTNADTMVWWNRTWDRRRILGDIRRKARRVDQVMPEVWNWIKSVHDRYDVTAYVCMPTSFDYQWLVGLLHHYDPHMEKITHNARCLTTMFFMGTLCGISRDMIGECPDFAYTHRAHEDAARQGWLYKRVLYLVTQSAHTPAPPSDLYAGQQATSDGALSTSDPAPQAAPAAAMSHTDTGRPLSELPVETVVSVEGNVTTTGEDDAAGPEPDAVFLSTEASQPRDEDYDDVVGGPVDDCDTTDARASKRARLV